MSSSFHGKYWGIKNVIYLSLSAHGFIITCIWIFDYFDIKNATRRVIKHSSSRCPYGYWSKFSFCKWSYWRSNSKTPLSVDDAVSFLILLLVRRKIRQAQGVKNSVAWGKLCLVYWICLHWFRNTSLIRFAFLCLRLSFKLLK